MFASTRCLASGCLVMLSVLAGCSSSDDDSATPGAASPDADGGGGSDGTGNGSGTDSTCVTPTTPYAKNSDVYALVASGSRIAFAVEDLAGDKDKGIWVATLPGAPQQLTNATKYADSVAIDGDTVFWGDSEGLWSIPFAGGTPTRIAYDSATRIAVDADRIYWQGSSQFKTLPRGQVDTDGTKVTQYTSMGRSGTALAGGYLYLLDKTTLTRVPANDLKAAPTTILDGRNELEAFVVDGDTIYAFDRKNNPTGDLVKVPVSGGAAATLASDLLVDAAPRIVVAGGNAYVVGLLHVFQVPVAGGTVRPLFCNGGSFGFAAAGSTLVWADGVSDALYTAPLP